MLTLIISLIMYGIGAVLQLISLVGVIGIISGIGKLQVTALLWIGVIVIYCLFLASVIIINAAFTVFGIFSGNCTAAFATKAAFAKQVFCVSGTLTAGIICKNSLDNIKFCFAYNGRHSIFITNAIINIYAGISFVF